MGHLQEFLDRLRARPNGEEHAKQIVDAATSVLEDAIQQQHAERQPKAYGYARVSHRDSVASGISFSVQEERIKRFVKFKQETVWGDVAWGGMFVDKAVSALTVDLVDRPEGKKLNAALKPGDKVVCYHIDRGFRNTRDCLVTLDCIWEPMGVDFAFVEPTIDTSSPWGRLMLEVFVAFAQCESRVKSVKNKAVIQRQKERGYAHGQAPWGFKNVGPKGRKRIVPDEKARDLGRLIIYLRDDLGWKWADIPRPVAELEAAQKDRVPNYMRWSDDSIRWTYKKAKALDLEGRDTRKQKQSA